MVHHGAPWAMGLEAGGVNSVTTPTGYGWVNGYSNGILINGVKLLLGYNYPWGTTEQP